ncbi:MAG: hydrogenase iron-sulfur subunit, partial [Chloroflexi bacterium]|nr:hydrogenase iron-sulfur subunit [Chloroflexota bacterium]
TTVVVSCNGEGYAALEAAGPSRRDYHAGARVLRLPCLGSISRNHILSALKHGADGVLLMACPEDKCHYESGSALAEKTFNETVKLLDAAGMPTGVLEFERMAFDGAEQLVSKLRGFELRIRGALETLEESEVVRG